MRKTILVGTFSILLVSGIAMAQKSSEQDKRSAMPGMMQGMMGGDNGMGGMMGMMKMMGQMSKMMDQCSAMMEEHHPTTEAEKSR